METNGQTISQAMAGMLAKAEELEGEARNLRKCVEFLQIQGWDSGKIPVTVRTTILREGDFAIPPGITTLTHSAGNIGIEEPKQGNPFRPRTEWTKYALKKIDGWKRPISSKQLEYALEGMGFHIAHHRIVGLLDRLCQDGRLQREGALCKWHKVA